MSRSRRFTLTMLVSTGERFSSFGLEVRFTTDRTRRYKG